MTDRDEIDDIIEDAIAAEEDRQCDGIHGPDWHGYSRAIRDALRAAGYVVVPREPTEAMMEAYKHAFVSNQRFDGREVYRAMLATHTAREGLADTAPAGKWGEHTNDVLHDSAWIAGAQFGWNCGQHDNYERLNAAIESRIQERVDISNTAPDGAE